MRSSCDKSSRGHLWGAPTLPIASSLGFSDPEAMCAVEKMANKVLRELEEDFTAISVASAHPQTTSVCRALLSVFLSCTRMVSTSAFHKEDTRNCMALPCHTNWYSPHGSSPENLAGSHFGWYRGSAAHIWP